MTDEEFDSLSPEEKKARFEQAVENYSKGFIEEDYVLKTVVAAKVEDQLDYHGKRFEDFKPSQLCVLFEAARADVDMDYFMNPKFSATHMRFILRNLKEGKDVTWLPVGKHHENIVRKPLTKAKIADIRRRMGIAEVNKDSVIADLREKQKEVAKSPRKSGKSKEKGER